MQSFLLRYGILSLGLLALPNCGGSTEESPASLNSTGGVAAAQGGSPANVAVGGAPSAVGGAPSTMTPSAGGGSCVGTLDEVRTIWTVDCPSTYCEAAQWANCSSVAQGSRIYVSGTCGGLRVVGLNWGTHAKNCYYGYSTNALVAADASDDVPTYCNRTSRRIATSVAPEAGCAASITPQPCPTSGNLGTAGAGPGPAATPPANCYNQFSATCMPCCPETPPDCTGKPDGSPGYSCTQGATSYCACQCLGEEWICGC
jgi:hypothetical protein